MPSACVGPLVAGCAATPGQHEVGGLEYSTGGSLGTIFKRFVTTFCGSGGCTRDFIINDQRYELFGGEPILVHMESLPVILVGRSGSICATSPNSVNCVQAYVWDERLEQFNTFGGHKKND